MHFQLMSQSKSFSLSFSAWPDFEPELPLLWNMSVEACCSLNCCLTYLVLHQKHVSMDLNVSVRLNPSASSCSRAAYETPSSHTFSEVGIRRPVSDNLCTLPKTPKHTCFTQRLRAGVWRWESKQGLSVSPFFFFISHSNSVTFCLLLVTPWTPCHPNNYPPPTLYRSFIFTPPASITVQSGSKHFFVVEQNVIWSHSFSAYRHLYHSYLIPIRTVKPDTSAILQRSHSLFLP